MSFDPDAYLATDKASSTDKGAPKGFDPDAYLSGGSSSEPVAKKPQETSSLHAGARQAAESVVPGFGGLAGAAAGASAMATPAGMALGLGPAGPIVAGALELGGAGVGAFVGAETVGMMQDWVHEVFFPEDYAARKAEREAHPTATMVGGVVGGAAGLSPRVAVNESAKVINTAMKARAASGVTQGGLDAGTQLATKGKIDPEEVAISVATGVALPGVNPLGKPFHAAGEMVGKKLTGQSTGKDVPSNEVPSRPDKGATPEQKAEWLAEIKKRKADLDNKAHLKQAAIKNKETGEVELHGPKHDEARKAETQDTHEQGFVDERGNFLNRKEAWERAKKTGQILKDQNPERPAEGLHSGDLRKAGVKDFEITEDKPAGTPAPKEEPKAPKSREDFKKAINDNLYERLTLEMKAEESAGRGEDVTSINERIKQLEQEHEQHQKDMPKVQFENPNKPTWEELHDHLWDVNTVGEAFDKIAEADIGTRQQKALYAALGRSNYIRSATLQLHGDLISYVDKDNNPRQDAAGLYTSGDGVHHIDLGKEGSIEVLAHEAVHAGTQKLIDSGRSKAAKDLERLYEKHKAGIEAGYEAALQRFLDANPNASIAELKAFKQKNTYGLTNVHEFIAEAFSNNTFRKRLSEIASDPNKPVSKLNNLWQSFKDSVAEGLGLTDRSALDDVLEEGIKLIEKSRNKSIDVISNAAQLASQYSDEIHSQLEKEGISVAHDSPHKFGMFDWIKHALSGQGATVKGAGTYFHSGEAQHKYYKAMSKNKAQGEQTPTYHSTIDAKTEELIDWNTDRQSDLVRKAFDKLGINPDNKTGEQLYRELSKKFEPTVEERGHMTEGEVKNMGDVKASIALAEQGVVGNFHASGKDPSKPNYVVFDDTKVKQNFVELSSKGDGGHEFDPETPSSPKEEAKKKLAYERKYAAAKAQLIAERQAGDKDKYNRDIKKTEMPSHEEILAAMDKQESRPSIAPEESKKLEESTSEATAKAAEKIDVRTIPNKEAFLDHATEIYHKYGEEAALKFFDDYAMDVNKRSIPVPKDNKGLDDALHMIDTWTTADQSEHVVGYKENTKLGITKEQREEWFNLREQGKELPPEAQAILDAIDSENLALVRKAKGMGLEVGDEFSTGQSRIRIQGGNVTSNWKKMITEFFANRMPFSEKVAETANAAHERKVFQLDDGRVIEIHRQGESFEIPYKDDKGQPRTRKVTKGTEIWEWKNGSKEKIGHSPDVAFKKGDKVTIKDVDGTDKELTMVDGKVDAIEKHSPYRYLHDAEASARLANMGLRKMVRDAELMQNLMKSDLFERVGYGPDKPIKDIPQGWKTPESIDKIPQLRGWHFDPKTAAIIEDFAKVWDNTMYMKLTNQIVKNLMLNPIPHMFNEMMHLWNARGFSGWVNPVRAADFAATSKQAWRDVGQQTQFYRDIMREGGSVLGADPRNHLFDELIINAGKEMRSNEETNKTMGALAKKLITPIGDLYNGISRKSQQAMWFSRDVMYVQLVREVMRTNPGMELKGAIERVERHMPNYRMPSEVLGSRGLAWTLKNPNITLFSRYHYGMVKSLVNTVKDMNPANLKDAESRKHFREGVDSALAIGVAMAVLYPLMDELASAMFGEGSEQRRAGPYHLIKAGEDVAEGKKDPSALLWPMLTFNPVLLVTAQLLANKKIFSGKEIFHPQDKLSDQALDAGNFVLKQVPQAPGLMGIASGEEGAGSSFVAKQMDIKTKTPKQKAAERTARIREAAATKSRDTKRKKGTYKP